MTTMTPVALSEFDLAARVPQLALEVVNLAEPLVFGQSPARDLELLRLLRAVTGNAIRLRWTMSGQPDLPPRAYTHLLPPSSGVTLEDLGHAIRWQRDYRYGSYYYRRGPGLVTVKDVRPGGASSRMVIADEDGAFLRLAESPTGEFGPSDEALVSDAVDAGLALLVADRALVLPFRLRHWPVPYMAI